MHEEGARELNVHEPNAIEAVIGWLRPMRRGDIDAVAEWFGDSFKSCPEDPASFERELGLRGVEIALDPEGPAEQAHGLPGIGQPISRERRTP